MLEINNTTKQKINQKKIRALTEKFLCAYKKVGYNVSLAIVADAKMRRLNNEYRGYDKTTDVLSFSGAKESKFLGEIVINIQEARRVGKYQEMLGELGVNLKRLPADYIFYFLLVHGLLHLCGYDDNTQRAREKMLSLGQAFLEKKCYN